MILYPQCSNIVRLIGDNQCQKVNTDPRASSDHVVNRGDS